MGSLIQTIVAVSLVPEGAGAAHMVGYMSVFGLLLIAGWWVSAGASCPSPQAFFGCSDGVGDCVQLDFYDRYQTYSGAVSIDCIPVFIHPSVSFRLKMSLLAAGSIFNWCGGLFQHGGQYVARFAIR